MGPLNLATDPTMSADLQVLLSGYAPVVLYGAVCLAGWVLPRSSNRQAAVTG
jgi:hypothetical protein